MVGSQKKGTPKNSCFVVFISENVGFLLVEVFVDCTLDIFCEPVIFAICCLKNLAACYLCDFSKNREICENY